MQKKLLRLLNGDLIEIEVDSDLNFSHVQNVKRLKQHIATILGVNRFQVHYFVDETDEDVWNVLVLPQKVLHLIDQVDYLWHNLPDLDFHNCKNESIIRYLLHTNEFLLYGNGHPMVIHHVLSSPNRFDPKYWKKMVTSPCTEVVEIVLSRKLQINSSLIDEMIWHGVHRRVQQFVLDRVAGLTLPSLIAMFQNANDEDVVQQIWDRVQHSQKYFLFRGRDIPRLSYKHTLIKEFLEQNMYCMRVMEFPFLSSDEDVAKWCIDVMIRENDGMPSQMMANPSETIVDYLLSLPVKMLKSFASRNNNPRMVRHLIAHPEAISWKHFVHNKHPLAIDFCLQNVTKVNPRYLFEGNNVDLICTLWEEFGKQYTPPLSLIFQAFQHDNEYKLIL